MAMNSKERKEHPSTYFVEDRSNEAERERVLLQDRMITAGMGGVLPEQTEPDRFHRVLDVGCGSGQWLIELAKAYPNTEILIGVDVSKSMVESARRQAAEQGVADCVEFRVMDALRMLEFPASFFDLVNQRLGSSYLRTWDWPYLLQEYRRVASLGGVVRITEGDMFGQTNSSALTQLFELARGTLNAAGHMFTPDRTGVTSALPGLLSQHGLKDVQHRVIPFHYQADTPTLDLFTQDLKLGFRNLQPFIRKWTRLPDDYDQLYQRALHDMQQPDFTAVWEMVTAWGTNSFN